MHGRPTFLGCSSEQRTGQSDPRSDHHSPAQKKPLIREQKSEIVGTCENCRSARGGTAARSQGAPTQFTLFCACFPQSGLGRRAARGCLRRSRMANPKWPQLAVDESIFATRKCDPLHPFAASLPPPSPPPPPTILPLPLSHRRQAPPACSYLAHRHHVSIASLVFGSLF